MTTGTVRIFIWTYGFIERDDGQGQVFVHYTAIEQTKEYRKLLPGQRVKFEVEDNPKGPRAINVKIIEATEVDISQPSSRSSTVLTSQTDNHQIQPKQGVRYSGILRKFHPSLGWGFIESADWQGQRIFLHKSQLASGSKPPTQGDQVEFEVQLTERGPRAIKATIKTDHSKVQNELSTT